MKIEKLLKEFHIYPFLGKIQLGRKWRPQNLMELIVRLLCCYYKSFITEPNGHHLPKYLYIHITLRKMHIWSRTIKIFSAKM